MDPNTCIHLSVLDHQTHEKSAVTRTRHLGFFRGQTAVSKEINLKGCVFFPHGKIISTQRPPKINIGTKDSALENISSPISNQKPKFLGVFALLKHVPSNFRVNHGLMLCLYYIQLIPFGWWHRIHIFVSIETNQSIIQSNNQSNKQTNNQSNQIKSNQIKSPDIRRHMYSNIRTAIQFYMMNPRVHKITYWPLSHLWYLYPS